MRKLMLAVLLLASCGAAKDEKDNNASMLADSPWRDANGVMIRGAFGDDAMSLYFKDLAGLIWRIDPSTALVSVAEKDFDGNFLAYKTPDCSGAGYIISGHVPPTFPLPRYTFTRANEPGVVRVRGDTQQTIQITRCSVLVNDGCRHVASPSCDGPYEALLSSETIPSPPLTPPVLDAAPPFHRD